MTSLCAFLLAIVAFATFAYPIVAFLNIHPTKSVGIFRTVWSQPYLSNNVHIINTNNNNKLLLSGIDSATRYRNAIAYDNLFDTTLYNSSVSSPIIRTSYNFEDDLRSDGWWHLYSPTSASNSWVSNTSKAVIGLLKPTDEMEVHTTLQSPSLPPRSYSPSAWVRPAATAAAAAANAAMNAAPSWRGSKILDTSAWRTLLDGDEGEKPSANEEKVEEAVVPPSITSYLSGRTKLHATHDEKIFEIWGKIKNRVSYRAMNTVEKQQVISAIRLAYVVLWGKTTSRSVEIAVNRAIGIAAVLGELSADLEVILAGITQVVLYESPLEVRAQLRQGIQQEFGGKVLDLAEKYQRLPKYMARTADYKNHFQAEYKMQMLVSTAEDYRTLYIRLADRLHTMRVLKKLPLEEMERIKIALEALHVYAPLAAKMNVMRVKGELEDLAFHTINPDLFTQSKKTQIAAHKAYHEAFNKLSTIVAEDAFLQANQVKYRITYRIKDKYQLFLKMMRKKLPTLNHIRDALGMRIIVDVPRNVEESLESHEQRSHAVCYHIIKQLLATMPDWEAAENGFKDYITNQKANGYQSIHQYLRNKAYQSNVEIQIRTTEMHRKAELGDAAHWYYKDLINRPEVAKSKYYRQAWRSEAQIQAKTPAAFFGYAKAQLQKSRVFVFLEDQSTVLNLKVGATCLDAAFAIHSKLGLSTVGVTLNGHEVSFGHQLTNGDIISVKVAPVSQGATAHPYWLSMVNTPTAQQTLRKYFRDTQRGMLACIGCIQLMMVLTLSYDRVASRFSGVLPDLPTLVYQQLQNTTSSYFLRKEKFQHIGDVLVRLGAASRSEASHIFSWLLDIPAEELQVNSANFALIWAKLQGKNGWHDKHMRNTVLLPLLRDVLPKLGLSSVEQRWVEVVGAKSLVDGEESPYYQALASRLISSENAGSRRSASTTAVALYGG